MMELIKLIGSPNFFNLSNNNGQLTLSKAYLKSKNIN